MTFEARRYVVSSLCLGMAQQCCMYRDPAAALSRYMGTPRRAISETSLKPGLLKRFELSPLAQLTATLFTAGPLSFRWWCIMF